MRKKGALEFDVPGGMIIAVIVGIVALGIILTILAKGTGAISYIKDFLRWG